MSFPKRKKLYLTLLLFVKEGKEDTFLEYEEKALTILPRYNGELIYRLRPTVENYINEAAEKPYEIHLVAFASEEDFVAFKADDERNRYAYLFQESVREVILIEGRRS